MTNYFCSLWAVFPRAHLCFFFLLTKNEHEKLLKSIPKKDANMTKIYKNKREKRWSSPHFTHRSMLCILRDGKLATSV